MRTYRIRILWLLNQLNSVKKKIGKNIPIHGLKPDINRNERQLEFFKEIFSDFLINELVDFLLKDGGGGLPSAFHLLEDLRRQGLSAQMFNICSIERNSILLSVINLLVSILLIYTDFKILENIRGYA